MTLTMFCSSNDLLSAKIPAVGLKRQVISPNSHKSLEDEVLYLRSQNKLLKSALNAVKDTATEKLSKSYELVWYARNRSKLFVPPDIILYLCILCANILYPLSYMQLATLRMRYRNGSTIVKSTATRLTIFILKMVIFIMVSTVACSQRVVCSKSMPMSYTRTMM